MIERLTSESIVLHATRDNPAYIIQAHRTGEVRDGVRILLGNALDTTFLGVGRHNEGRNIRKLHVKTDARGGARFSNFTPPNPYDLVGGINGVNDLVERIVLSNKVAFSAKEAPGEKQLEIFQLNPSKSTLVVGRGSLGHVYIAPELRGQSADPFFNAPMRFIRHSFGELVDAVREMLPRDQYLLID